MAVKSHRVVLLSSLQDMLLVTILKKTRMGNRDSKLHEEENREESVRVNKFIQVYKALTEDHEKKLTVEKFQKLIFPEIAEVGNLLFEHLFQKEIVSTETHDVEVQQDMFVQYCSEIVEMQDTQKQVKFYMTVFSQREDYLSKQGVINFVGSCFKSALILCGCDVQQIDSTTLNNVADSMLANEEQLSAIECSKWVQKHCPRLLEALHCLVCHRLETVQPDVSKTHAVSLPALYNSLHSNNYLLSLSTAWLVSCVLSTTYIPVYTSSHMEPVVTSPLPLMNILHDGWHLLYDSNSQGLGINRFQHHVFQYKGPTVTLLSFEGHCYCVSLLEEWREDSKFWGGSDCSLIQLQPCFKLIKNESDLVFLNWSSRSLPKGLQIGSNSRTRVLEIDEDFLIVKHYGVTTQLHRLEVWGCGGQAALEAQRNQKAWEKKDILKQKDRKLKLDDWEENPDRLLLEYGGVKTEHAEK